jgi:uncharacterized membrane protein
MIPLRLSGFGRLRLEQVMRTYESATLVERRVREDVAHRVALPAEVREAAVQVAGNDLRIDLTALADQELLLELSPEEARQALQLIEAFTGYQAADEWAEDAASVLRANLAKEKEKH